ncbi:MAG: aldehyde reductase [Acidimicrobiales bacterium]|nr:aldehyde reductase [Acidimicrobiales bacterium]
MTNRVLITGASGYIAKHTVFRFLNAGYIVRGSVRRLERGDEVRSAVAPHVNSGVDLDQQLEFVALDLGADAGWDDALNDIDVLVHMASPFPIAQPKDESELIRPAVDGTLRALRAAKANGVNRVVMTSSAAAITGAPARPNGSFDESDWTDLEFPELTPYVKSKTLAERAAWDFVENDAPGMQLTVINPVFVLGAPLDSNYGSSIEVIERVVGAKDPAVPRVGFSVVDVGDIAEMHLRAAQRPETAGERIAGATRGMWFSDIAQVVKDAYPDRKVVTRGAPKLLLRIMAIFDKEVAAILPALDRLDEVDNAKARSLLDMKFIDPTESVRTAAAYVIDNNPA